jgi:hypothetical protein
MLQVTCQTESVIQWASAVCALMAALFWLWSAVTKLPPSKITFASIDDILPAIRKQSWRSAVAAIFAALAAILQAALINASTCINLG